MRRTLSILAVALVAVASSAPAQVIRPDTSDNWRWLEDMTGERSMTWVKAENSKTAAVIEKDPR
ncbi:MAG: hypothetical protein ABJE47_25805, partial [bacterium]